MPVLQVGLELLVAVAAAADGPAAQHLPAHQDAAAAAAAGTDAPHQHTTGKGRGHRAASAGAAAAAAAAVVLAADADDDSISMGGTSSRGPSNKSSGARGGSRGTAAVSAGGLPLICQVWGLGQCHAESWCLYAKCRASLVIAPALPCT